MPNAFLHARRADALSCTALPDTVSAVRRLHFLVSHCGGFSRGLASHPATSSELNTIQKRLSFPQCWLRNKISLRNKSSPQRVAHGIFDSVQPPCGDCSILFSVDTMTSIFATRSANVLPLYASNRGFETPIDKKFKTLDGYRSALKMPTKKTSRCLDRKSVV